MQAVHKLYRITIPMKEENGTTDIVCGTDYIRLTFGKNFLVSDIIEYWNKDVEHFRELSKKYYLYE